MGNVKSLIGNTGNIKNYISAVYDSIMHKITSGKALSKGESFGTLWRFGDRPCHAGQIVSHKVLPNGNTKLRIFTALAGDSKPLAYESIVMNSARSVVSKSCGLIDPAIDAPKVNAVFEKLGSDVRYSSIGTAVYGSTLSKTDVGKASNRIFQSNPGAKRLLAGNMKII